MIIVAGRNVRVRVSPLIIYAAMAAAVALVVAASAVRIHAGIEAVAHAAPVNRAGVAHGSVGIIAAVARALDNKQSIALVFENVIIWVVIVVFHVLYSIVYICMFKLCPYNA